MKRLDLVGIVVGVAALLLIGWLSHSTRKKRISQTECPYHLKELYIARENLIVAGKGEDHFGSQATIPNIFSLLCSYGLSLRSTVCPLDSRVAARTVPALSDSNVSYFVSSDLNLDAPSALVAGNRNAYGNENRRIQLGLEPQLRWRPGLLHGTNGYVLLREGSVKFLNDEALRNLASDSANASNILLFP